MCDCFHLAFPNWHGPGTGAGRRLRGPEREAEDDSACEGPTEFVEGERPRPQGSSPVEEFPAAEKYTEKQGEDDFYDSLHKTGSGKKGKKVGFGSLFDKRSSGKMSQMEELQNGESEVLVKTAKEACSEGLVVTGGGKDGIFIKEVKPDSPASKNLSVKEGDQILSATVYFDNVSYEDALQILEHAQSYKMEFCLKRKPPESTVQDAEAAQPEGEAGSPKMRGRKTKRQEARISWPKFPSFSKGRKGFKRSHSTSEAEEQRKLEMSPTTSDTESPAKSPLKSPDGKEKKKKKRLKLKVKMKGLRSKSVEHPTREEEETLENLGGVENLLDQNGTDIQSPEEMQLLVEPQVVEQEDAESPESTKVKDEYAFPRLADPEMETGLHKVELITLDKTLKTTDISVALAEGSPKEMRSSESVKIERSELRVNIQGKDLLDHAKESQTRSSPVSIKDQSTSIRTSDPFTFDNVVISPSAMSRTDFSDHQFNVDINTPTPTSGRTETTLGHGEMDMSMPKVDVSLDMSDIGLLRKSPRHGEEKQWKDKTVSIPEPESYGIRTRGPMADMATSKVSFDALNGLQFTTSDGASAVSVQQPDSDLKFNAVISQPKSSPLDISIVEKNKDGTADMKLPPTSEISMEKSIDTVLADVSATEGKVKVEYKLPKVDISETNLLDPITLTKVDHNRVQLPNREELEIPGMEDATSTAALQIQAMKLPHIDERDKFADEIQAKRTEIEFNLEDVKALVAKMPTFKLPRIDMSGIHTHKEITPDSDKILATAETPELSEAKTDVSLKLPDDTMEAVMIPVIDVKRQDTTIKLPNVELPHLDDHQPITVTRIEDSIQKVKSTMAELKSMTVEGESGEIKYKLPKREDIEIPGMEAIVQSTVQMPDVKSASLAHSTDGKIQIPFASAADVDIKGKTLISDGKTEKTPTDRKDKDKKKKTKKSMPSFGITKPDIRFPDIGIDLPKQTTIPQEKDDSKVKVKHTKTESAGDDIKTKTPQSVSLDIQKPEIGIKCQSIGGEIYTSKEEGQIPVPEVNVTTDKKLPSVDLHTIPSADTAVLQSTKGEGTDVNLSFPQPKLEMSSKDILITQAEPDEFKKIQGISIEGKVEPPELEIKDEKNFTMPKFGISLPKMKGPDLDISVPKPGIDVSLPEGNVAIVQTGIHVPSMETTIDIPKADVELPSVDGKGACADTSIGVEAKVSDTKVKKRRISFPKFSFSRSDSKGSDGDGEPPKVDITAAATDVKDSETGMKSPDVEAAAKDKSISSSPTKFKIPTLKFPKFGISPTKVQTEGIDVDVVNTIPEEETLEVTIKGHDVTISGDVPTKEVHLTSSANVDVSTGDVEAKADVPQIKMETHEQDTKITEGSKFKMPKFGISLPKVKGPEISLSKTEGSVSASEYKSETQPDVEIKTPSLETETDMVHFDSKETDIKFKMPKMSFPKFGHTKSEMKAIETDVTPKLDISLSDGVVKIKDDVIPQGSLDIQSQVGIDTKFTEIGKPDIEVSLPEITSEVEGSQISNNLNLPSVDLTTSKPNVDITGIEMTSSVSGEAFKSDIILPSVDVALKKSDMAMPSSEIVPPDGKVDAEIPEMNIKDPDGSPFKMPKFGISMPKVKLPDISMSGSKPDVDVSVPEGKVEVKVPDSGITVPSVDTELPQAEAKEFDAKIKKGKISFPKFGFSKPDVKTPEVDVTLPKVDVSVPESEVQETKDIKLKEDAGMTSPKKFKLPTFRLHTFGTSTSQGIEELSDMDINMKTPKVNLPETELNISGKVPALHVKGSGVELDMSKGPEVEVEGMKVKSVAKFEGPEVQGSVSKPELDVSLPEGKVDVDVALPQGQVEMPGVDSKGLDVKLKRPSFSFPKFGFSKADVKVPDVDIPEGNVEVTQTDVDVKIPEGEVQLKDINVTSPTKFKLPTIKFPKIGVSAPKGTVEVPTDIDVKGPEVNLTKADLTISGDVKEPEIHVKIPEESTEVKDSKSIDVKTKRPSFSFPKFGFSKPDIDVTVPKVDMSLPEGKVEITEPEIDAEIPEVDAKAVDIHTSPSKFKLPTFKLPKIGVSAPKGSVQAPDVDINIKAPEVTLPDAEIKVSGAVEEPDLKGQNIITDSEGTEVDGQGSKFKLPNFGISSPKIQSPEIDVSVSKPNVDVSLPEGKVEIDASLPEVKAEIPEVDSKGVDVKVKRPSFSFPKFGWSKPDVKAPDTDVSLPEVDTSLPEGKVEIKGPEIDVKIPEGDAEYRDTNIQTSPTKFKLPTLKFPKIGVATPKISTEASALDINVTGPDIKVPDAELNISGKIPEVDIKGQNVDVKPPSIDVSASTAHEADGQGSKVKFPKFGISLPKVKGPEFDGSVTKPGTDISVNDEGKVEIDVSLPEGTVEVPVVDSKSADLKMKRPSFSFPKFGLSKPDVKAPVIDADLPEVDIAVPEGKVEIKGPEIDVKIPEGDVQHKDLNIHASPTKFKLPTFKLPKIGVSASKGSIEAPDVDIDVKTPDVSLPQTELKVSGDVPAANIESQSIEAEGPEVQGGKVKLPKFGISLPKVKGPEVDVSVSKPDIDISLPERKADADVSLPEGEIKISGDSKGVDLKMKRPSFSFPKFGFSKPDVKAPGIDADLPEVDIAVPEGKVEIKGPEIDVKTPEGDVQHKDLNIHASPTKFKLPTFKLPKIGVSASKGSIEAPDVDIDVKTPDVSLPQTELKVSGDVPAANIESQSIEAHMKTEGPEVQGGKVKLPKFGISLPKVKGPEVDVSVSKPDIDISLPERKADAEVSLPEGEIKISGVDSKSADLKMKRPSFSFPKFGFSKPDVKAPGIDADLPEGDIAVPEGKVEIKGPEIDVKIPEGDVQHKDLNIHASPTKFKLPTFKLPKIGVSASKGSIEAPDVDIDVKTPDVSLPQTELKVSGDVPAANIESQSIEAEGPEVQGGKVKLPKFGISLPKVKGPEVDVSVSKPDLDISLPERKADADVSLPEGEIKISGDSKGADLKMKRPSFSFPKFGFSKPDVKTPEIDVNIPEAVISVPEGKVEVKETDVQGTEADIELKDTSTITSPTKFKLPTFKFPKIGVSAPKGEMNVDVTAPEVSATETELKVSMDLPKVDIKDQAVEVQTEGHDSEGQEGKLPKFGITLPKVKGPDIDISVSKPGSDASIPKGKIDIETQSAEVKADIPEIDSKGLDLKTKRPSFTFPKFSLSKTDVKIPHVDATLPKTDVSLPEATLEVKDIGAGVQVSESEVELKDSNISGSPSKFKLPTIKLPKFGITAPKVTIETEHPDTTIKEPDMNAPDAEGKGPSSVTVTDPSVDIKVALPEVDSKGVDVTVKRPSFSFPRFGFSKSDKIPEADASLPKTDISPLEENIDVTEPKPDSEEGELKPASTSGSPSKFKLPTIKFPKFGVSVPKVELQETDLEVRGQDAPDSEVKVPEAPVDMKVTSTLRQDTDVDVQAVGVGTDGQASTLKFPKFGVSLSKGKGSEVKSEREVSLPEGKVDMEGGVQGLSVETRVDVPDVDVTARKPSFTFPKFGFSKQDVKSTDTDGKTEEADISKQEAVETQNVSLDVKSPDGETPISSPTKFKLPTFKLPTFGGTAVKSTIDITVDPSLPQGIVEVETDVKEPASEVTPDSGKSDVDTKDVKTKISFPRFSFSKPAVKAPEVDVPSADVTSPVGSADVDVDVQETEPKGEATVGGSPSKFKLPTIKLPKFGITTPKIESEVTVPEGDRSSVISAETDVVEGTVAPDNDVSPSEGSKILSSPSKFKLPTFKLPRLSISKEKSEDAETPSDVKPQEVPVEGDKGNTQVTDKSPKFTFPTVQDVLRGFDVEFHVPTLDEPKGGASQTGEGEMKPAASVDDVEPSTDVQEKTKIGFQISKLGFTEASGGKDGDVRVKTEGTLKESVNDGQKLELKTEQKSQDTKESPEKGSWFKLPKFPSPTKSVTFTEREIATPREDHEQNTESENLENEISITSSVRSSDAFADVSSAPTTEQISSLTSPTKVTVKYGHSISTDTGDVTANIITSTARTELISMDPDLPEKVNISFSSDSSSMDTLKQESGAIHIITSNVQALPDTQKATIQSFSHTVQSLPVEQVIVRTTSTPWSIEESSTMQEDRIVVEKHVITEMSGESMEKVIITQKTSMLDADSGEPSSNIAALSSQKLRDTVNKEKMLFFESREMPLPTESIVVSSVTTEKRVIKHSTEKSHGK